jgi:hypothetical protein
LVDEQRGASIETGHDSGIPPKMSIFMGEDVVNGNRGLTMKHVAIFLWKMEFYCVLPRVPNCKNPPIDLK